MERNTIMKKIFLVMCFVFLFASTIGFAQSKNIPDSEAALGGVHIGASMDYVRSIYGEPSDYSYGYDTFGNPTTIYRYGNGYYFYVYYNKAGESYINEITTDANNGIATPAGITVGTPEDVVMNTYGRLLPKKSTSRKHYFTYTTHEHYEVIDITTSRKGGNFYVSKIHLRFEG